MKRVFATLVVLVLVSPLVGCQGMRRPQWFNPGPIDYQRQQAQRFDPYPDQDVGPRMEGTRPPGYQQQGAEPTRARWNEWGRTRSGY